ncbi:universal stress protein [Pseudodesulfovibrio sediminis]|uniref:Universal stress protein n=1 Tax=Pseudodesulfovibrio sediminis TaxID=2810563 RepID=A0ABM7P9V7_9BACT|nr:universal stress protein [Pseudodesulfovibrio sediminis]BCS89856.1 hypothetical protein PSDVSF_30980 [Pseudodesulfovibrio sediminis]
MIGFFKRFSKNPTEMVTDTPIPEVAQCDCERQECKILIVCKGAAFSDSIADYAIDMAQKTRSSLVALNLDESGKQFDDFCSKAKQSIQEFSCKAMEAGLGFAHEVRQGNEEAVVSELYSQDPQFRYIMDDAPDICKRGTIPVYTRATLHAK